MYIEDLIATLANNYFISVKRGHLTAVHSLYTNDQMGIGYTEKQLKFATSIIKHYTNELGKIFNTDITQFLLTPVSKRPLRVISTIKRITVTSDENWTKVIHMTFLYNEDVITEIRSYKKDIDYYTWDETSKAWVFALTELNIDAVYRMGVKYHFDMSDEFLELANSINAVIENFEQYIPILSVSDQLPVYKNVSNSVPELVSTNIVDAVFEARSRGITTWDDQVEALIDATCADQIVKDYLKHSTPGEVFKLNPKVYTKIDVLSLIRYLTPCVFVLAEDGAVFENIKDWHTALNASGIANSEISVMFRLDSSIKSATEFNQYIKCNGLNNPVTNCTKAVFISGKVPKPLIASGIKFNSVVNLDPLEYPKYTTKLFINSLPNIIYHNK